MSKLGYDLVNKISKMAPVLIPVSIIGLVICAIFVLRGIGRKAKQEEICLDWFDRWKLEIALLICSFIITIGFAFFIVLGSSVRTIIITGITVGSIIVYLGCILLLETMVKRIKTHTVWKSTLLYAILHGLKEIIDHRNISTKLILLYWGFCLLGFFTTTIMVSALEAGEAGVALICMAVLLTQGIVVFSHLFKKRKEFEQIQLALKHIYEGNTNISLNTNEMQGVLKQLAIYIEDIAGGLSNAVNESLKSERLKTELITNVSHDIKTPLTSIINYVDLLKKEKMPNEKCTEYLMILDNKSQRLKKLTEDLVEASKASSGNIKLQIEKINVIELIKQVSGEFEDRFQARGLEEIMTIPEEPVFIKADGRYMYRVLENLYSNSSKYAMENTRIYVDVVVNQKSIVIQMKNISQEKLNIGAEELMQRFVRGDGSRNTEGSGLGLSIATSLTQLQGGKFHIYLDGDLFKVTLGFEKMPND
ncbi:MAG: sensor histidine kinase [Clostridia bacterium]|nr:sensor histidine kinase [Clostridia bacterium]